MKYIIPQSKLENIIFKYLDMKGLKQIKTSVAYNFYIPDGEDGKHFLINCGLDGDCFISSILAQDVCDMFSIDPDDSLSMIRNWIESKTDIKIVSYNSDFGAD